MYALVVDVVVATTPVLALTAVTWRLVWPRWKLVAKVVLHPLLYAGFSLLLGHSSILVARVHQRIGLAGRIWLNRKHGFSW
jgi:hypothetical protein